MEQVKATVYTTVWVFIGIEGAVVISGRAKNTSIAGKATILAFISLFILYVLISILSMGVMTTEKLAALGNPPMAFVLKSVVGSWGSALVNIGVIISVGGALFTYTILCVDSIYAVSYTHLDVYKRQPLKLCITFPSSPRLNPARARRIHIPTTSQSPDIS